MPAVRPAILATVAGVSNGNAGGRSAPPVGEIPLRFGQGPNFRKCLHASRPSLVFSVFVCFAVASSNNSISNSLGSGSAAAASPGGNGGGDPWPHKAGTLGGATRSRGPAQHGREPAAVVPGPGPIRRVRPRLLGRLRRRRRGSRGRPGHRRDAGVPRILWEVGLPGLPPRRRLVRGRGVPADHDRQGAVERVVGALGGLISVVT